MDKPCKGLTYTRVTLWRSKYQQKTSSTRAQEFSSKRACRAGRLIVLINHRCADIAGKPPLAEPCLVQQISERVKIAPICLKDR